VVVAYSDKYTYEAAGTNHTSGAGIGNGNYAFDNNCNMSITIDITGGTVIAGSANVGDYYDGNSYPVNGIGKAHRNDTGPGPVSVNIGGNAVVLATSIYGANDSNDSARNGANGVLAVDMTDTFDSEGAAIAASNAIMEVMALDGDDDATAGFFKLTKNFTVPDGATLTVPPGWTLYLDGKTLTNNGTVRGNLGAGVSIKGSGTVVSGGSAYGNIVAGPGN